jgi:DNA-binding CsgD family transcriptional regulator
MARGDTHKQIAQMLSRSPATVRNQIRTIYEKLEVGNVAGLIEELRLAE